MTTRKDLDWAFERCLVRLQNGASLETVLAEFPEWKQELRPVLEAVQAVWESRGSDTVPIAAMARSRAQLREEIQRRQALAPKESLWRRWWRSFRAVTVPAAVLLLVVTSLGVTSLASLKALPGEPLYPVKLAAERFTLSLPASAAQKLAREEVYDTRRNQEVEWLIRQQREQEVAFTGYLTQGADQVWRVDEMALDVPVALVESLRDKIGRYVYVRAELAPDGQMVLEWIEDRLYSISGRVQAIKGAQVKIDEVWVELSPEVAAQSAVEVGDEVTVSVVRFSDGRLLAIGLSIGNAQPAAPVRFDAAPGSEEESLAHP